MLCHICEAKTDFNCARCGEPVCEDCCVVPTYMNQIEEARCTYCESDIENRRWKESEREWQREEAIKAKKKAIADKRQAIYRKPENVEKRRIAKIARKQAAREAEQKRMEQAVKIVSDMFRGMF
jgi:hypothetical protein